MSSYGLTSLGLLRRRAQLRPVLGGDARMVFTPFSTPIKPDVYVGWGAKKSGLRANLLAAKHHRKLLLLEDGFLSSFRPGKREVKHSYFIDTRGIHFDRCALSDLQEQIQKDNFDDEEIQRAHKCINDIRNLRLSKYNHSADLKNLTGHEMPERPYVLIVEQVAGDASLPAELPTIEQYRQMLMLASKKYPDLPIVIRTHPASKISSPLLSLVKSEGYQVYVCPPCNIWDALDGAHALCTISSHVGFEALMAGIQVETFGSPFYAGWSLTSDHHSRLVPSGVSTLAKLFIAAYIRQSKYIDIHTGQLCEIETAIEQLSTISQARRPNRRRVHTVNFSPWRRHVTKPFLVGALGQAKHHRKLKSAEKEAMKDDGVVALWGAKEATPRQAKFMRLEDGFIRSNGLGADLHRPLSICTDGPFLYFDNRGESRIESLLRNHKFENELLNRARELHKNLIRTKVSKYGTGEVADTIVVPNSTNSQLKILVPGQVVDDAALVYGNSRVKDNYSLVYETRERFPESYIVFKEHPDVVAKLRDGGPMPIDADTIVRDGSVLEWIDWADRIETISSLTGFEALLRGCPVGVYGVPFYAGWGLTDDRNPEGSRNIQRSLDELVAASLILYPSYIHPRSLLPCSPEKIISELNLSTSSINHSSPNSILRRSLVRILKFCKPSA
ncbi:MAG: hypothetical protein AAGF54_06835 [Pseudomonadota bacterium]